VFVDGGLSRTPVLCKIALVESGWLWVEDLAQILRSVIALSSLGAPLHVLLMLVSLIVLRCLAAAFRAFDVATHRSSVVLRRKAVLSSLPD